MRSDNNNNNNNNSLPNNKISYILLKYMSLSECDWMAPVSLCVPLYLVSSLGGAPVSSSAISGEAPKGLPSHSSNCLYL